MLIVDQTVANSVAKTDQDIVKAKAANVFSKVWLACSLLHVSLKTSLVATENDNNIVKTVCHGTQNLMKRRGKLFGQQLHCRPAS